MNVQNRIHRGRQIDNAMCHESASRMHVTLQLQSTQFDFDWRPSFVYLTE